MRLRTQHSRLFGIEGYLKKKQSVLGGYFPIYQTRGIDFDLSGHMAYGFFLNYQHVLIIEGSYMIFHIHCT